MASGMCFEELGKAGGGAEKQLVEEDKSATDDKSALESIDSKVHALYNSVTQSLSALLVDSSDGELDGQDSGAADASSKPASSALPTNAWYDSVKSTLESLTAATNIQSLARGQQQHQQQQGQGKEQQEQVLPVITTTSTTSSEASCQDDTDYLAWVSGAKERLDALSQKVQGMDWASFSANTGKEGSDTDTDTDDTDQATKPAAASGDSIKDQLLIQIGAVQSQLNQKIDSTRAALGEAVHGMLPEQLQRPWVTACAQICLNQEIHPELLQSASVRLGSGLCGQEADFQEKRLEHIRTHFAEFIRVAADDIDPRDIPVIGVAGSGGGFRAMVSTIGSYRAMYEAGLAQCVMYDAAVSGSSWAVAALHTYGEGDPLRVLDSVRKAMQSSMFSTTNLFSFVSENDSIAQRVFNDIAARYLLAAAKADDDLAEEKRRTAEKTAADEKGAVAGNGVFSRVAGEIMRQGSRVADLVVPEPLRGLYLGNSAAKASLTVDELIQSAKETLRTMSVPPMSIVELYGALLFKQLIVQHTEEPDGKSVLRLDPRWMKLSSQREAVDRGDLPMPIYTAVRHFLGSDDNDPGASQTHGYQWFEFSPYEVGSIDHGCWVPTWAFGRPIKNGKEQFKIGEIHFGSIMGTVASAFCASVKAMVMEIYLAVPSAVRSAVDPLLDRIDQSTEASHLIPPYTLYNPFYKTEKMADGNEKLAELQEAPFLSLMDAGLENNMPFAPLLRPERNVDVIICLDSSADIDMMPWFVRAEAWASKHGVERWPWGARPWAADPLRPSKDEVETSANSLVSTKNVSRRIEDKVKSENMRCVIFDHPLAPTPEAAKKKNAALAPTISVLYLPLLPNSEFCDVEFVPQNASFCATFNDKWTAEQVDKLADLTSLNFTQELERIRAAIKKAYERKRDFRLYREMD
ncbi:hypothetical protein GGI07_002003 [Coemansia sp. Benny D115]|nr:hypothetical protein GGI07_002003 [Coemansia sp. Benny D115]